MSTHALDPHDAHHGETTILSDALGKVSESMPASVKGIFKRARTRVEQALAIPGQMKAMIEKVKDGHPLTKAEWAAIMATPGSMLIVGYYALKVTENTTSNIITEIRSQYHALLEGLGLRKEATPDEFPEAVAKHEAQRTHGKPHELNQAEINHHTPKPEIHAVHERDADTHNHAANDDHAHHTVEHPGEHAEAA